MTKSGRSLANTWRCPRHGRFERDLRLVASRWFAANGLRTDPRYPYRLESWKMWPDNIIDPAVVELIEDECNRRATLKRGMRREGFPLHNNLHHGLSSQAMLLNLIGPLVVRSDLAPLKAAFSQSGLEWPDGPRIQASFEYENWRVFNEDDGQPTSIDLVVKDGEGVPKLFSEAKLVETEFGGCYVFGDGDCDGRNPVSDLSRCYLHHVGRLYWDVLEEQGFMDGPIGTDSTCILASHYQFFREVLFAFKHGGTFVLLYDERSPTFYCRSGSQEKGLMPFLTGLVPERLRARIGSVRIQQVVQAIKTSNHHPWITEFEMKYGLGIAT